MIVTENIENKDFSKLLLEDVETLLLLSEKSQDISLAVNAMKYL